MRILINTKDNKRHQETIQRVYATFSELLREQELNEISVTELCESANIERSTFYANFEDISALANTYSSEIEKQVAALPHEEGEFSWIFEYILENKDLFHVYFKLGTSQTASDYTFLEMVSIPSPNCGLKRVVLIPHKRWEKSSKESM